MFTLASVGEFLDIHLLAAWSLLFIFLANYQTNGARRAEMISSLVLYQSRQLCHQKFKQRASGALAEWERGCGRQTLL